MSELLEHAGLIIGLLAVFLLPVLLPGLFGRPSAITSWAERIGDERGWRQGPRRNAADAALGGGHLPIDTPTASGDCGGGGGGGDCG